MNRPRFRHPQSMGGPSGGPRFRHPNTNDGVNEVTTSMSNANASMSINGGSLSDSSGVDKPLFYRPPTSNQQYSSRPSHQSHHNKSFRPPHQEHPRPQFTKYPNPSNRYAIPNNNHPSPPISTSGYSSSESRQSQQFNTSNNGSSSIRNGTPPNMVLSKIHAPGARPLPAKNDVLAFLREFKPLECNCCLQVIGFQHRLTGVIMCKPECDGPEHISNSDFKEQPAAEEPRLKRVEAKPVFANEHPRIPVSAPVADETEYRHVSTVHRYENPPKSYDQVDHRAPARVTKSFTKDYAENQEQGKTAEVLRKDINPFYKSFPSAKELVPPQVAKATYPPEDEFPDVMAAPVVPIREQAPAKVVEQAPPKVVEQAPPRVVEKVVEQAPPRVVEKVVEQAPPRVVERAPAPPQQATRPAPPASVQKAKYSWFDCKFSKNLLNGADVKVAFVWGLNKYQMQAACDEVPLQTFHEKVQNFVASSTPMTRKPVKDEMVIGIYGGEYYRARVIEVREEGCKLVFVDYGDACVNKFEEMYELNDELMEYPIASVTIILTNVPRDCSKVKAPKTLNDHVFSVMTLDLEREPLIPTADLEYESKLWISDSTTLNKLVYVVVEESRNNK